MNSQSCGTKLDSIKRLGQFGITSYEFKKEGVNYSLLTSEGTLNICGDCALIENDFDENVKVFFDYHK